MARITLPCDNLLIKLIIIVCLASPCFLVSFNLLFILRYYIFKSLRYILYCCYNGILKCIILAIIINLFLKKNLCLRCYRAMMIGWFCKPRVFRLMSDTCLNVIKCCLNVSKCCFYNRTVSPLAIDRLHNDDRSAQIKLTYLKMHGSSLD